MGIPELEKRKEQKKILEIIIGKNFPILITDTKPWTQPSENTNLDKYQKSTPRYFLCKLFSKENLERSQRG